MGMDFLLRACIKDGPIDKLLYMKTLTFIITLFFASLTFAAPIPGAGNKAKPKLGVYKSPHGFQIATASTDWIQTKPPKNTRYIATMFRSPDVKNKMRATLTVRVDQLSKPMDIAQYVKRWTKEYPKFGFDVKGSKKFSMKGEEGIVVDLINPAKKRQLRQVIFMKDNRAVLMTCRDHISTFKQSLAECNKMIKSFEWKQLAANKTTGKKKL
jgi:hypothetical protein